MPVEILARVDRLVNRHLCTHRLLPAAGDSVLLTFDDGPDERTTPEVLQRLRSFGARAVFFVVGRAARRSPSLLRRIVEEGHLLGNHTYSHHHHPQPIWVYRREILWCQKVVRAHTGIRPRLFRPPYGRLGTGGHLVAAPWSVGLRTVIWSAECGDWEERPLDAVRARASGLAGRVGPGDIILLHDDRPQVLPVLDILLPALKRRRLNLERGAGFLGAAAG